MKMKPILGDLGECENVQDEPATLSDDGLSATTAALHEKMERRLQRV